MAELKLPSKLTSFEDVTRAFRDLEKNINTLHKAKSAAESETKETEGESGDIRATRNVDGTYTFEVRTEEGWKTPALGDSVIKFKDKPSTISQNIVKSIEDIAGDDSSTGDEKAKKVAFDEKNGKFVMPRPDYDSGWFEAVRNMVYATGATTGTTPNTSAIYTDASTVGIKALGFTFTDIPMNWEVLVAPTGTTSWSDIDGTTDSWITRLDQQDIWFSAHNAGTEHNTGLKIFITSDSHVAISTGGEHFLDWYDAGGNNVIVSNVALRLRIWK